MCVPSTKKYCVIFRGRCLQTSVWLVFQIWFLLLLKRFDRVFRELNATQ